MANERRHVDGYSSFADIVADDEGVDLGGSTFKLPAVHEDAPVVPTTGSGRRSVGQPGVYRIGQIDDDDEL